MRSILLGICLATGLCLISICQLLAKPDKNMAKLFNGYFQQDTTKKKDSVKILVDSTAFKAKAIKTTNPQITVTGKVLDEKNVGLSGVVIKVKGKTNSFFTDLDGKFKVTKIIFKKIKWALPFLI